MVILMSILACEITLLREEPGVKDALNHDELWVMVWC